MRLTHCDRQKNPLDQDQPLRFPGPPPLLTPRDESVSRPGRRHGLRARPRDEGATAREGPTSEDVPVTHCLPSVPTPVHPDTRGSPSRDVRPGSRYRSSYPLTFMVETVKGRHTGLVGRVVLGMGRGSASITLFLVTLVLLRVPVPCRQKLKPNTGCQCLLLCPVFCRSRQKGTLIHI